MRKQYTYLSEGIQAFLGYTAEASDEGSRGVCEAQGSTSILLSRPGRLRSRAALLGILKDEVIGITSTDTCWVYYRCTAIDTLTCHLSLVDTGGPGNVLYDGRVGAAIDIFTCHLSPVDIGGKAI